MTQHFPYPIPEFDAQPFWEACNRDELQMQRCSDCEKWRWTPGPLCEYCGCEAFRWERLSGRETVYTWTVVRHPVHPAAVERVPYIVVEVALQEQNDLHLISNLIDLAPDEVEMGMPVEVTFVPHPQAGKLPLFRPRPKR